jgi:hypothetical protein
MPRPKRAFYIKTAKEAFTCPRYIATAAKLAAGHPEKDFSPWVVAAITAKLQRENAGLLEATLEGMKARALTYPELESDKDLKVAEGPNRGPWKPGQSPGEKGVLDGASTLIDHATNAAAAEHAADAEHRRRAKHRRPKPSPG